MQKLGPVVGTVLCLAVGCTHLPPPGVPKPASPASPAGAVGASAPPSSSGWTDKQCESNAIAQDVWGGLAIGGAGVAGVNGVTSVQWSTEDGQRNARITALIGGVLGVVATLIGNNVKNRGAEHCGVGVPPL